MINLLYYKDFVGDLQVPEVFTTNLFFYLSMKLLCFCDWQIWLLLFYRDLYYSLREGVCDIYSLVSLALISIPIIIFSSNLLFTFWVIASSLLSFLFSNEIWSIASVNLDISSGSLCKSVSTITFPFKSNIFCANSYFFREFNANSERFKKLNYFYPFWLDKMMCPRKETMNLNSVENFVGLCVYPTDACFDPGIVR